MCLFALDVTQLVRYFQRYPNDWVPIRLLVVAMFLVDVTATANSCAMVYLVRLRPRCRLESC
jgi:hypothetical protein